ncbi:MAG: hypothetical protein SFZ02_07755 [bacterium]|nr:hypothetical protein [bacterium]
MTTPPVVLPVQNRIVALDVLRGFALFGAMEWLWRSLTYWQIQPIRRKTPMSAPESA